MIAIAMIENKPRKAIRMPGEYKAPSKIDLEMTGATPHNATTMINVINAIGFVLFIGPENMISF